LRRDKKDFKGYLDRFLKHPRIQNRDMDFQKQVNKLCGYTLDFGPNMSIVLANMNKALKPYGYGAYAPSAAIFFFSGLEEAVP
jgi:hypothetical protein